MKNLFRLHKVYIVTLIVFITMLLVIGALAITGNFQVNVGGSPNMGIYDSTLSGSGVTVVLNPLWELISFTQLISMLTLPVTLLIGWKWLRINPLPWLLTIPIFLLSIRLLPIASVPDRSLISELPSLLHGELLLGIAVVVGFMVSEWLCKRWKLVRK